MSRIFVILFFLCTKVLFSQTTEFDKYGIFGSKVYTDLKLALDITKNVYKMDLSYQKIDPKLYPKISKLKDLQALKLSGNDINQFPGDFTDLYNLQYFATYNNAFTQFPENLKNWANLSYLEFFATKIDSIPSDIAYLSKLKTFKFSSTEDTLHLPQTLKYLKTLKELTIENCVLDSSSIELFKLPNIVFLSLAHTGLKNIPVEIRNNVNVEVLVLDANELTKLPYQIYKLKNLSILSVRSNQLLKLPDSISQLENLSILDVRGNNFSKEYIQELKALLPGCEIRF